MFEDILKIIKPSEEEIKKTYSIIEEFLDILKSNNLEVFLGGSFAKNTWLSGDYDVDVFVLFEKDEKEMSNKIENVLKNLNLNYEKVHGSRDYFKVFFKNLEFELVPALKIKSIEEAENVIDLSPFHVKYVKEKICGKELEDDIRLLKAFMKGIGVYGAESYIRGFSGYLCELLIIYYKSFMKLLENSIFWKPKVFIDIEGYYKDLKEAIKKLGKDKTRSPIVLIDPTNPNRNAAASLSTKKFAEFIFYSYLLLNDIKENKDIKKYFIKEEKIDIKRVKEYGINVLYLEIEGGGRSKEIKNAKAQKFLKKIIKKIKENNFLIFGKKILFEDKKVKSFIYVFPKELPKFELRRGPLVWNLNNFSKFFERHKNEEFFIEDDGRIYVITERKIFSLEKILEKCFYESRGNIEKFSYKIY